MVFRILILVLLGVLAKACDMQVLPPDPVVTPPEEIEILILNEGLFRRGNASISSYNPITREVKNNVLTLLDERSLDVLQSATTFQDSLILLVSNNTNELILCRRKGLQEIKSFDGLGSPRYALELADGRVLVSDLYAGALLLLDVETFERTEIPFASFGESIIEHEGGALIASPSSGAIYQFDLATEKVIDSLHVGFDVSALLEGPNGLIIATGGVQTSTDTTMLVAIDWGEKSVQMLDRFSGLEASFYPRLGISGTSLYVLQANLETYEIGTTSGQVSFTKNGIGMGVAEIAYGLGIDAQRGEIYVADAGATFGNSGRVIRLEGRRAIDTFMVGSLPNGFLFP